MRACLLVSLALNLLLLATIVPARVDRSLEVETLDPGGLPAAEALLESLPVDARRLPLAQAETLLESLQGAGLAAADIRSLVAGWLEADARRGLSGDSPAYWEPGFAPAAALLERELAVSSSVQQGLIALFGDAAATDPAFEAQFSPLGPAFAFLSPAEQRALRLRQLAQARRPAVVEAAGAAACTGILLQPASEAGDRGHDALAELLSGPAYEEYRLRFSPLAARLRQAAVAANETEFRELFGLLRQLEAASTPALLLDQREELRSRLGARAFDRLWSSLDPLYTSIERYLSGQGFGPAEIANAYAVFNRTQDALLALMTRSGDQSLLLEALARHRETEAAELTELLGEPAAAGLTAAVTSAAMGLGTGQGRDCLPAADSQ